MKKAKLTQLLSGLLVFAVLITGITLSAHARHKATKKSKLEKVEKISIVQLVQKLNQQNALLRGKLVALKNKRDSGNNTEQPREEPLPDWDPIDDDEPLCPGNPCAGNPCGTDMEMCVASMDGCDYYCWETFIPGIDE